MQLGGFLGQARMSFLEFFFKVKLLMSLSESGL